MNYAHIMPKNTKRFISQVLSDKDTIKINVPNKRRRGRYKTLVMNDSKPDLNPYKNRRRSSITRKAQHTAINQKHMRCRYGSFDFVKWFTV